MRNIKFRNLILCIVILAILFYVKFQNNEIICKTIENFTIFIRDKDILCNYGFPSLMTVDENMLIQKKLDYPDMKTYNCCYGSLDYVDSHSGFLQKNETCTEFHSALQVSTEFAYVQCSMKSVIVYEDFYFFLNNHQYRPNARQGAVGAPSVIVLILGHTSRHVFHQAMPKTVQYLEQILKAQEFHYLQGHVRTHKNLQNLIRDAFEEDAREIWLDFARSGYTTAYGDDCSNDESKLTPSDVLLDRFYPFDFNWESFYAIGRSHIGNQDAGRERPGCLGARPTYARLLDYAGQYVNLRNDNNPRPLFGVFYIDAFRYDRGNLRRADRRFLNFFQTISSHLNRDTALMFVGDNVVAERVEGGNAKEAAARTAGNYVKSPPLFYFLLPISYKIEYPDASTALEWNSKKMVTYADIHSTLRDLIKDNRRSAANGYSLLKKIPAGRSCSSLGISPHWCLCHNGQWK